MPLLGATDERKVYVDGVNYIVHYQYDEEGMYSIPATSPPGRPHYWGSLITIYAEKGKDRKFIAERRGVYVKGGPCLEDDPEKIVRSALKPEKQDQR